MTDSSRHWYSNGVLYDVLTDLHWSSAGHDCGVAKAQNTNKTLSSFCISLIEQKLSTQPSTQKIEPLSSKPFSDLFVEHKYYENVVVIVVLVSKRKLDNEKRLEKHETPFPK